MDKQLEEQRQTQVQMDIEPGEETHLFPCLLYSQFSSEEVVWSPGAKTVMGAKSSSSDQPSLGTRHLTVVLGWPQFRIVPLLFLQLWGPQLALCVEKSLQPQGQSLKVEVMQNSVLPPCQVTSSCPGLAWTTAPCLQASVFPAPMPFNRDLTLLSELLTRKGLGLGWVQIRVSLIQGYISVMVGLRSCLGEG